MFSGVATTPGGGIDTRGGRGVTGQRSPGQRGPGQRGHGLTPIAPCARSSRCRTGGVLNLQAVFPSGGKGHKIRLAQENGGTTPWRNLSSSIVAADRRSPVRASRFTTLSITLKRDGTPRLSRRSSASARARLTRHFAISRSMRKKSAQEYHRILARAAKGNPPELQSQLDAGHARFLEHVRERARASGRGDSDESNPG